MTYLEASTITNTYDALKVDLTSAERLALRKLKLHKVCLQRLPRGFTMANKDSEQH